MAGDKTKWGVVVLGAGAAALIVVVAVSLKNDAPCALTAPAVKLIASGVRRGSSAQEILDQADEFAPDACELLVATVVNEPNEQVSFVLELPDREEEQTVTGATIVSPPPALPPGTIERLIKCLGWDSDFLYQMCVDGRLFAPSG